MLNETKNAQLIQAFFNSDFALVDGLFKQVKFSDTNTEFYAYYFDSLQRLSLGLDNLLTFIILPPSHSWFDQLQFKLAKQAIAAGANPRQKIQMNMISLPLIQLTSNWRIFELLQQSGATCELDTMLFPISINEMVAHSTLLVNKSAEILTKIPVMQCGININKASNIHYVWVPNPNKFRNIPKEFFDVTLKNKRTIDEQGVLKWIYTAWSVNWYEILDSGRTLQDHGFVLKNISDISPYPNIFEFIPTLQTKNLVGLAKDLVAYIAIFYFGGMFLDFDMKVDNVQRMEQFFSCTSWASSFLNGAFMGAEGHPFLNRIISTVERFLHHSKIQYLMEEPHTYEKSMLLNSYFFQAFAFSINAAASSPDLGDVFYLPYFAYEDDECCYQVVANFSEFNSLKSLPSAVFAGEDRRIPGYSYLSKTTDE